MFSLKFGLKTVIFQAELQAAPVIPPVFFSHTHEKARLFNRAYTQNTKITRLHIVVDIELSVTEIIVSVFFGDLP